jgi:hypothetical protein
MDIEPVFRKYVQSHVILLCSLLGLQASCPVHISLSCTPLLWPLDHNSITVDLVHLLIHDKISLHAFNHHEKEDMWFKLLSMITHHNQGSNRPTFNPRTIAVRYEQFDPATLSDY